MAAQAACFQAVLPIRSQLPTASVSSIHGCDESHQTPIRIKRAALSLPVALAASLPQKNVGAKTCPMVLTDPWLPNLRLQSLAGPCRGRSAILQTGDGGSPSHSHPSAVTPVAIPGLATTVVIHAKQRAASNGLSSFSM